MMKILISSVMKIDEGGIYMTENKVLNVTEDNKPIYNIVLNESYNMLEDTLNPLHPENRKICIVSDSNVCGHYLETVCSLLKEYAKEVHYYIFPEGEINKNLDTVKKIYEYLILHKYNRDDMLAALGGGVVGDLTGFAAATYLRGIPFIQLPTSLLSMVDSSIGGKTGVDFEAYKNMVGAFHQPKLVYINLATLDTLDNNQYYSGYGEIIKHGLIKDKSYYQWIRKNVLLLKAKDPETVGELIYRSCTIKKNVVEQDVQEKGERALLNFGHTIGHAVEKLMDFNMLHGECVAIGMVAAGFISWKRGHISKNELDDMVSLIETFELPTKVCNLKKEDILEITKHDKKMEAGRIKFILLEEIGRAVIDKSITDEEMLLAIDYITY